MAANLLGPTAEQLTRGRRQQRPIELPRAFDLGSDVTLWLLPVGGAIIRRRQYELDASLAGVEDSFRFAVVMAGTRFTGWLPCYAFLLVHPGTTVLVDTGESPDYGTRAYFRGTGPLTRSVYRKLLHLENSEETSLPAQIERTGVPLGSIDACVLTHTHSDHLGNVDVLSERTAVLVNRRETERQRLTGRLVAKLPPRTRFADFRRDALPGFTRSAHLADGVRLVPTPGHTSLLIEVNGRSVWIVGDAAFDDGQLTRGGVQGVAEGGRRLRRSQAALSAYRSERESVFLFSHDAGNGERLAAFLGS